MLEVVRKEVLKLLDHLNTWVSTPTQVLSKKDSMMVHRDEMNVLITTRLITRSSMCINYRALNATTHKDHFFFPFIE